MNKVKKNLDSAMDKIKEKNPNASWGNLLTGVGILILIALASVWYFGRTQTSDLPESLVDVSSSTTDQNSDKDATKESGSIFDQLFGNDKSETVVDEPAKVAERVIPGELTKVEAGEGLWNVAVRVCSDGEKYNYLAEANGLTIWSPVAVGQELVIACGPSK